MFKKNHKTFKFPLLAAVIAGTACSVQAQGPVHDTVQHQTLQEQIIRAQFPPIHAQFNMSSLSYPVIEEVKGNGSVNNILDLMPSVVTTSDAGTGLGYTYMRVRGVDQTRINVTLDGITLNDAESQGAWLTNLPDMGAYIGQVDVQRGGHTSAGSVSYGSRIDFVTREIPAQPFAELRTSYGSFNTLNNSVSAGTGLIGGRFSALATFSDIRSDGFVDHSDARLNSAFLAAQYRLLNFKKNKDYGTLKLTLLHGSEHTGMAWDGVPTDSLETNRTYNPSGEYWTDDGQLHYYDGQKDHYKQTHAHLSYIKDFADADLSHTGKLTVTAHLTRGLGYYQQYKDDKKPSKYGLEPLYDSIKKCDFITTKWLDNYYYGIHTDYADSWRLKKHVGQFIKWGVGVDVNNYNGKHYGDVLWAQPNRVLDFDSQGRYFSNDYRWYDGTGDKLQSKVYANIEYIIRHFSVSGEVQYRHINHKIAGIDDELNDITQDYKWDFINPKVTLCYSWGNKFKQSANISFSTANREPTRKDLIESPEDKKAVPETLYDMEAGYQIGNEKFNFDFNLYGMYYENQLVLTGELNDVGAAIMTNVDKSYRVGVELAAAYQPAKFFTWHINGCFSKNSILDYVEYVDDWDNGGQVENHIDDAPISFSPAVVLGNKFTFTPLRDFNIDIVTKFVSKQYMDNSGTETHVLAPYSYTNLHVSYTFHFRSLKDLGIYAEVNNVFNAEYESNAWLYSYYTGGRRCADAGYFPQAGINFVAGLRLKF